MLVVLTGCTKGPDAPTVVAAPEPPAVAGGVAPALDIPIAPVTPTMKLAGTANPCWIQIGPKFINMHHVISMEARHSNELYGVVIKQDQSTTDYSATEMSSKNPEALISSILELTKDCNRK